MRVNKTINLVLVILLSVMCACTGADKMRNLGEVGNSDISTGENGEGYSGENGEGYSGIIKPQNGFPKCVAERRTETDVFINCEAWVKLANGTEKKAEVIEAGVSLNWQPPVFSIPSAGKIIDCTVLSNGLVFQCAAEVPDTVVVTVLASLNITEQSNTQTTNTTQVPITTPTATTPPPTIFSAGSGTAADPYLISSVQDLKEIAKAPNVTSYYKLTSDINLASSSFTTIGNYTTPFQGIFDGNGKTISNYSYSGSESKPGGTYVGLFGYLKAATIKNLTVANVVISSGGQYRSVGALAGYLDYYSVVTNCSSSGSISANGNYHTLGGLVGNNNGTISLSHSSVTINVSGMRENVGGLVGSNNRFVSTSYASGSVTLQSKDNLTFLGGLIGVNHSATAKTSDCYSLSAVLDTTAASTAPVGGLIGSFAANSNLVRSYFAGTVTSTASSKGGLVGVDYTSGSGIQNSYYDVTLSGISGSNSKTTLEMKTLSTFENWDFTTVWNLTPGNYPTLR